MTDLTGALQTAVYNKLRAVSGLPPVVSEVPIGADDQVIYPFVLLGDDQVTEIGTKDSQFEQHDFAVHVCMQSTTKLIVRGYQELVRAALHHQPITAPGAIISSPVAQNASTPLLDDGATYIGSQTFQAFLQPAD